MHFGNFAKLINRATFGIMKNSLCYRGQCALGWNSGSMIPSKTQVCGNKTSCSLILSTRFCCFHINWCEWNKSNVLWRHQHRLELHIWEEVSASNDISAKCHHSHRPRSYSQVSKNSSSFTPNAKARCFTEKYSEWQACSKITSVSWLQRLQVLELQQDVITKFISCYDKLQQKNY